MSHWPFSPLTDPLLPDEHGFFGNFGGCFVPEILAPNLAQLAKEFNALCHDQAFWHTYTDELVRYSGRPTPITHAKNLSAHLGGAQVFLKREDLNQTGAHKANNVIGQGLLAHRLGKSRLIAETGAGQHGVATATVAARLGMSCVVYMGAKDVERQRPNVFWMEQMGAEVVPVASGNATLKDAINEAMRDWSAQVDDTHYVLGTACGPHPFPALVAWLQSVIGIEARAQMQALGGMPHAVFACVGGGSNALGIFQGFCKDPTIRLVGAEAGGKGPAAGQHAARLSGSGGRMGIAQGYQTLFLQNNEGQMLPTHSVAAGLDYVGVSPILAHWRQQGLVEMEQASDDEVIAASKMLMEREGIIPALESAHGLAVGLRQAQAMTPSERVLINVSGRGDKDIFTVAEAFSDPSWQEFLRYKAGSVDS